VYVDGEYSRECCPEYLKEHNFYKLKNGLVDCISVHTTTITEFLDNYPGFIASHWQSNQLNL
jgi:S-adenosylmethionine-diacylglycerol 3-amino-3-carboxypropyl transferase